MTDQYRILLVDDELEIRRSLAYILGQAGYLVDTAECAAEARRHLQAGPYDLMLLDLNMPGQDGIGLLTDIRPAWPHMPVLILTAYGSLESAIDGIRQGISDYVLKPASPAQILARVKEILSEDQRQRQRDQVLSRIHGLVAGLEAERAPTESSVAGPATESGDGGRLLRREPFVLDLYARRATMNGLVLALSPTGFDYLATLARHAPHPVPYETLVREAQGYQLTRSEASKVARWHVHELRQAVEIHNRRPRYVITVRGVGYLLAV